MVEPNGVAVSGTSGRVVVADSAKGAFYAFSASGVAEGKFTGSGSPQGSFRGSEEEEGNVSAVAIDEGTGDVLVAEGQRHVVSEFNAAGEWVGWITNTPTGVLGEPRGVAVTASGGVFVADTGLRVVDEFGPGVVVPDVVTGKASKVTRTTALLNGSINGDGKAAKYSFQWGTSEALGNTTVGGCGWCGGRKGFHDVERIACGDDLFCADRRRKRKRHELWGGTGIHDLPGGGRCQHWCGHEPGAHDCHVERGVEAWRGGSPLLFRMGHHYRLWA